MCAKGGGKCDPDARCCTLCALAALERAIVRLGPPRQVVSLGTTTISEDYAAGVNGCPETGITHVFVGTSGDVSLELHDKQTIVLRSLVAGVWHPVPFARKLLAQGTTAEGVLAGW